MDFILGDNPFFGVSHRVGSKELEDQDKRFENASEVIVTSLHRGFSSFMLSSHDEGKELVSRVNARIHNTDAKLNLSLVVPYPHTINDLVAEHGYFGGWPG